MHVVRPPCVEVKTLEPKDIRAVKICGRLQSISNQDVDLVVVDPSRYFESDRLGIRATMRVAFGFPHRESIVRIAPEPGT
jgi:hypothetical protein